MFDEIMQRRPKRHLGGLNIVPILDMLTTIIFFLLISTSFIEYTKLTLPPAKMVISTKLAGTKPVLPKLLVTAIGKDYSLRLVWQGSEPGSDQAEARQSTVASQLQTLIEKFALKYPAEKTLQVSLDRGVNYQVLISVMDGARALMPDVVLLSYQEVTSL